MAEEPIATGTALKPNLAKTLAQKMFESITVASSVDTGPFARAIRRIIGEYESGGVSSARVITRGLGSGPVKVLASTR